MKFQFNDGGRAAAGFKGSARDCVVRAIAIVAEKPYKEVYDALNELAKRERTGKRKKKISNSRTGVYRTTYERYLRSLGFVWVPTMKIGQGCRVHLVDGELPMGRLIVSVSRHLTAVIDGVIHDTYNPADRGGEVRVIDGVDVPAAARCVYGYYYHPDHVFG